MPDKPAARPNLRLIAGDLVSSLAHDVAEIAEVALTGKTSEERKGRGNIRPTGQAVARPAQLPSLAEASLVCRPAVAGQ